MTLEPDDAVAGDGRELAEKPRLADPGLAQEHEDLPAARLQLLDRPPELVYLGVAAHERRRRRSAGLRLRPDEAPGADRPAAPLDGHVAQRLEHEAMRQRACG